MNPIHLPRRHHRRGALATILAALALAALFACAGCNTAPDEPRNCSAIGQQTWPSSYNGYSGGISEKRCELPE
jgi:hypothetical protein